ncbi:arsenite S-adenosylmethyltransferase [Coprinopsis sp. MPI-PUGE-AT-0042]|nr:arsenite S-adenosylmethyltransferase [Coprinopsis sp. MPI-PUGE-AT-0042]
MSCCSNPHSVPASGVDDTTQAVTHAYGTWAQNAGSNQAYADAVAAAFGYTAEDLRAIPAEANLGLSCGNPTATANIKEGERILDLGSGGGIDVLLAASKVGPKGQAIGLDGSSHMVDLSRRNAYSRGFKPPQVAFVLATLDKDLPIESNSIDCVISNCVINLLSPTGKKAIFQEVARVLKPGGRVVIDDLVAKKPLPDKLRNDLNAFVSCIAGALTEDEYRSLLAEAGFQDPLIVDKKADVNAYWQEDSQPSNSGCCKPDSNPTESQPQTGQRLQKPDVDVNEWIGSYQIYALKPKTDESAGANPELETALKKHWDAYPAVKSSPPSLTNDEVAKMMLETSGDKPDFVVIDVRRNDHGGGHVRDSEQWAAQTFYDHRSELFEKHKDKKSVIFYCGSSNGRGPRCAGWYQDYLDDKGEEAAGTKAYVLQGGIKAWLAKFQDKEELVDRD